MPVTAKLSKAFYERFGEQIAGELVEWFDAVDATYRSDLRDLNELNFARFDAKLEQRATALESTFDRRFAAFEAKSEQRFVKIEQRATELEARFEQRLVELEARFEQRLVELEARLTTAFRDELAALRTRDLADIRIELRAREGRVLRWMLAQWVSTVGIMIALLRFWG